MLLFYNTIFKLGIRLLQRIMLMQQKQNKLAYILLHIRMPMVTINKCNLATLEQFIDNMFSNCIVCNFACFIRNSKTLCQIVVAIKVCT